MRQQGSVTFRILRYDPLKDKRPHFESYQVPLTPGMTVLDGLLYIKENIDATLVMRYSCRMGVCGSCGVLLNGKPDLACHRQIAHLHSEVVEVAALNNHPVVKDLVCDFDPFFDKHRRVKPYLIRKDIKEQENPTREYVQTPDELLRYLQFSYCIKCGCCVAVCPTSATDKFYLGPAALVAGYRYSVDSRDEGEPMRVKEIDRRDGIWKCHFAGACSHVCPRGVDPALALQLLKARIVGRFLGLVRKRVASGIVDVAVADPEKIKTVPKPPPFDF